MLFFDASPPGKRLWCSSSSGCGNRAKTRRHRQSMKERKDPLC
jgi:predicted RNA-binding Zn ribbon-like protein